MPEVISNLMKFIVVTYWFLYRKKVIKKSEEKTAKELQKNVTKPPTTPYYSTITAYTHSPYKRPETTPYYTTTVAPCYATTPPVISPNYISMTSPHNSPSLYSHLQHHNTPTIAPIKRSTSDNCLTVYEKINPQHQKDESNSGNVKSYTEAELHHK